MHKIKQNYDNECANAACKAVKENSDNFFSC